MTGGCNLFAQNMGNNPWWVGVEEGAWKGVEIGGYGSIKRLNHILLCPFNDMNITPHAEGVSIFNVTPLLEVNFDLVNV